tara:strand:+ start:40 stop:588 length:549 start_codon:yes stop_codon:yes gene_type:complete
MPSCPIEFNKVAPQTILKLFGNHDVALINSLSNDIVIGKLPFNNNNHSCCYGKNDVLLDGKLIKPELKHKKLIIVYCANCTCSASRSYAKQLVENGIPPSKISLYEGGTHEWASYSLLLSKYFTFVNLHSHKIISTKAIKDIFKNDSHMNELFKHNKYGEKYNNLVLDNSNKTKVNLFSKIK